MADAADYVDAQGHYAGSFGPGTAIPQGLTAVSIPAPDGRCTWDGTAWSGVPAPAAALAQLQAQDATMFRALEVLIDILIAKGTIVATDVTPAIRTLYLARKALRVTAGVP